MCATKVIQEVNFPKYLRIEAVVHPKERSCSPILWFSLRLRRQMAPQKSAKFRTTYFRQFCSNLRRDSVANYASIWTFPQSVRRLDVLYNALKTKRFVVTLVGGATRFANLQWKSSKTCKIGCCAKYSVWLLLRLTSLPAV